MNATERSGLVTRTSATPGVIENPRTPSRPIKSDSVLVVLRSESGIPRTLSFSSSTMNAQARTTRTSATSTPGIRQPSRNRREREQNTGNRSVRSFKPCDSLL